ncbi:hypothetical protein BpHYR1_012299 [Brachionus plicatilis]|uniref:Uncharacterized protein n=1 Tax=Brachionus plicatilis TaxID=10195 RepID=A0A3M7R793_BRAPC|nr:hypothetical protein BpHYR1_012299 [Brachionus plicatilis]
MIDIKSISEIPLNRVVDNWNKLKTQNLEQNEFNTKEFSRSQILNMGWKPVCQTNSIFYPNRIDKCFKSNDFGRLARRSNFWTNKRTVKNTSFAESIHNALEYITYTLSYLTLEKLFKVQQRRIFVHFVLIIIETLCFADLQSFCRDLIWVVQSLYQLIHFAEQFLDSDVHFERL